MKPSYKNDVSNAMANHLVQVTEGKPLPVVFSAYHLLDQGTKKNEVNGVSVPIGHPYGRSDSRRLVKLFGRAVIQAAIPKGVTVITVPEDVLQLVASGRQAVVDELGDQTSKAYAVANDPRKGNPLAGFVAFGPDCDKDHPVLHIHIANDRMRDDAIGTAANKRVMNYITAGHLSRKAVTRDAIKEIANLRSPIDNGEAE